MQAIKRGLPLAEFTELCELDRDQFRTMKHRGHLPLPSLVGVSDLGRHRYQYDDALTIEIAKLMHADGGLSLRDAICIVASGNAAEYFLNHLASDAPPSDFWVGAARFRLAYDETWGSVPVCGTFADVVADLGSHRNAARFLLANVTLAHRILSGRAATKGYLVRNCAFCGAY